MSDLRRRQLAADEANRERTRAEDAHRAQQQAAADRDLDAKIARAHAGGRGKTTRVEVWPGGRSPRRGG